MSWALLWILGFFVIYLWLGTKLLARLLLWAILGGLTAALFIGDIAILAGAIAGLLAGILAYRVTSGRQEIGQTVLF